MTATRICSPRNPGGPCHASGAPMNGTLCALRMEYVRTSFTCTTPGSEANDLI
jgi:hypothetical protein